MNNKRTYVLQLQFDAYEQDKHMHRPAEIAAAQAMLALKKQLVSTGIRGVDLWVRSELSCLEMTTKLLAAPIRDLGQLLPPADDDEDEEEGEDPFDPKNDDF